MGAKLDGAAGLFEALQQSFGYLMQRNEARRRDDESRRQRDKERADRLSDMERGHNWDVEEIELRDRLERERDDATRTANEAAERRARGGEFMNVLQRAAHLPERNRGAYITTNGKMTLRSDDFLSDEELAARAAAEAKNHIAQVGEEAYAREAGSRRAQRAFPTPVTPTGDDPTLPLGVKKYLGEIAQRHPNDPDAARQELNNAMQLLYADHPNLDAARAVKHLETLTGAKPKASDQDFLYGPTDGTTPAAAPPIALPQAAPAGAPPAGAGPSPMQLKAEQLLGALQTETDPQKRAAIKAELATIKRQLLAVQQKF